MTKVKYLLILFLLQTFNVVSQNLKQEQLIETQWDQGIPFSPTDSYINALISKINVNVLHSNSKQISKQDAILCREVAIAFYNRGQYDAADWYLDKAKGYVEVVEIQPEVITKKVNTESLDNLNATNEQLKSLEVFEEKKRIERQKQREIESRTRFTPSSAAHIAYENTLKKEQEKQSKKKSK